jgi:hypothetical protein
MTEQNTAPSFVQPEDLPENLRSTEPAPKRGPGRPKKAKEGVELRAVPKPMTPGQRQAEWQRLEREARAETLGVSVSSLEPLEEPKENWRESLPKQSTAANPLFAGLYRLTGGHVCMEIDKATNKCVTASPGTYVRLSAEDGRSVTARQIGVRVAD